MTSRARQVLLAVSTLMYIGASAAEMDYLLSFTDMISNLGQPTPALDLRPNARFYFVLITGRLNVSDS